jgi:hypothetical protein
MTVHKYTATAHLKGIKMDTLMGYVKVDPQHADYFRL